MGVAESLFHPVVSPPGSGLTVAAAMVPLPCTQVSTGGVPTGLQSKAPVGTLPSPTALPPEFMNAENGTNSYSMLAPARMTVFWLPWTSHANPTRGDQSR